MFRQCRNWVTTTPHILNYINIPHSVFRCWHLSSPCKTSRFHSAVPLVMQPPGNQNTTSGKMRQISKFSHPFASVSVSCARSRKITNFPKSIRRQNSQNTYEQGKHYRLCYGLVLSRISHTVSDKEQQAGYVLVSGKSSLMCVGSYYYLAVNLCWNTAVVLWGRGD